MAVSDSDSRSQSNWQAVIDALVADRELLTERIRKRIRAGFPAYRTVSDREFDWGFWIDFDSTLRAARAGHERACPRARAGSRCESELRRNR